MHRVEEDRMLIALRENPKPAGGKMAAAAAAGVLIVPVGHAGREVG